MTVTANCSARVDLLPKGLGYIKENQILMTDHKYLVVVV